MTEIGTLLQNRYSIEKKIGAGGMGAVYLAEDRKFGSRVAIKETFYRDDELAEAFQREARLLNSLFHPVLPYVSDYFTEGGGHYIVMQYVEGEDLFETLKREGAFPVKDVLRWTDSLLDALDYLHSQETPIIHRDIKPQNLKITPRGDVILLDFGLAKLSSAADTTSGGGANSVFGYSRKYSPLEQIEGVGTDERSDLFALAATAYHLLTGKPPADALSRAAAIVAGKPDPIKSASEINPEVPVGVSEVLRMALALNADRRFVSAKAMRLALENAVTENAAESLAAEKSSEVEIVPVAAPPMTTTPENETLIPAPPPPSQDSLTVEVKTVVAVDGENDEFSAADEKSISGYDTKVISPAALPSENEQIYEKFDRATAAASKSRAKELNHSRRTAVAAAVLLVCAIAAAAAGWFLVKNQEPSSSPEAMRDAEISSSVDLNRPELSTVPAAVPVSEGTPLITVTPAAKAKNETKEAPIKISAEKEDEEPESVREAETVSPRTETASKEETTTRKPAQNKSRPNAAPERIVRQNEARTRNETETAPDIEAIFTGRSRWEEDQIRRGERRARRVERRRQQEAQMDDEVWIEERRERRRQRRPDFPF